MKRILVVGLAMLALAGCSGGTEETTYQDAAEPASLITVAAPEPVPVPEPKTVSSDTDWEAKAHNKEIEVLQVINIINPVAAYITAGFEQYGDKFSETLNEEWTDTQVQLTKALTLYEDCKVRKAEGKYDKQLFLDLEEVWQLLVKTGVAGVRTKQMVDAELQRALG